MTLLKFNHANLATPVYIPESLIFAHYYSPGNKATLLVASGGAIVPVSESPEEVSKKLESARTIKPVRRAKNDGTSQRRNDQV